MLTSPSFVCGVSRSILGQPWRWRGLAADDSDRRLPARRPRRPAAARPRRLPRGAGAQPPSDLARFHARSVRLPRHGQGRRALADAVEAGEAVTIFGDYDVDGATSAALLIRLLRGLGLDAKAYIPDRLMEGYGPSGEALVRIAEGGASLVVTVDCGAQAFEALAMAKAAGVDVMVVDHHKCATQPPRRLRDRQSQPARRERRKAPRRAISPRSAWPSCSARPCSGRCGRAAISRAAPSRS